MLSRLRCVIYILFRFANNGSEIEPEMQPNNIKKESADSSQVNQCFIK